MAMGTKLVAQCTETEVNDGVLSKMRLFVQDQVPTRVDTDTIAQTFLPHIRLIPGEEEFVQLCRCQLE